MASEKGRVNRVVGRQGTAQITERAEVLEPMEPIMPVAVRVALVGARGGRRSDVRVLQVHAREKRAHF
jgi:hypothetical protein